MAKRLSPLAVCLMVFLAGCGGIGEKSGSLSSIYAVAVGLSLLLLIGYCCLIRQKDLWFILLFTSMLIVNIGYFSLAVSKNLNEALLANRITYLGSVFLPFFMLMILLKICGRTIKNRITVILVALGIFMLLVAASPGHLSIYYKEVSLRSVNGITVLEKVYGPWHIMYLLYLAGYYSAMLICLGYVSKTKKLPDHGSAVMIVFAVTVNLLVWLAEQLVNIEFEFLSVSYIISGGFLLGLCFMRQDAPRQQTQLPQMEETKAADAQRKEIFAQGLAELTATERKLYNLYMDGMSTQQILETLNIKDNTLKYHNRNLYSKLGVSSRKELRQMGRTETEVPQ